MANMSDTKSVDGLLSYFPNNPNSPSFASNHEPLEELSLDHRLARRQRRRRRFLRAFFIIVFVWLAAHAIFRTKAFKSCFHGKYKHLKVRDL
jgi:hypothetical protein